MRLALLALAALALTGCATWDGLNFGLSVATADATITLSQGDGKTVLAAEQEGQRVTGYFRR